MNCFSMLYTQFSRQSIRFCAAVFFVSLSFSAITFAQEEIDEQESPVIIFNQGQEAHEKGDLQAAINSYEKALKLLPEFPEAEYQKGIALLALRKTDEAEKSFRRAVELRADWTLPMASLGLLLTRKNQFPEAEKILLKAIELDGQNFPALAALTELRIASKTKPETLRELLEKLKTLSIKANPTASVWASRGILENYLGDKPAAKTSLSRALEIDQRHLPALTERAEIALAEGDSARALENVKILLANSPNSPTVKILQARVYAETGKSDEALNILDSMQSSSPDVAALRDVILANSSTNAADLEKQLEKDAKNAFVLGRLCTILRTANPLKAIDYCRRASEAQPENINHAIGFGAALVQAKRYDEAVNLFRRLTEFAPDNFTVRANYATALFQLKRFPAAKAEYLWLTEKQPNLAIAFYFLGITHDQLGEYLDAMANYQQFLRLADQNQNKLEIEKVNLRLPSLQKQIKDKKGKKNG
jgi:tetratricopeptide (TPR) repeat protein